MELKLELVYGESIDYAGELVDYDLTGARIDFDVYDKGVSIYNLNTADGDITILNQVTNLGGYVFNNIQVANYGTVLKPNTYKYKIKFTFSSGLVKSLELDDFIVKA